MEQLFRSVPIIEYCHLNLFCKVAQSSSNGANDSYHNLASPINVKWKCLTLSPSGKLCASIPISSTKKMGFCILFRLTWEFRFLPYPILINYLGSRHYNTSRGWLCWGWLWWWLDWYILTKFEQDLELELELQDLELEFDLQGLEPDFDLQDPELGFELWDPVLDLWDLVLHPQIDVEHLD